MVIKVKGVIPKTPFKQGNPSRPYNYEKKKSYSFYGIVDDREIYSLSEGVSKPPRSSFALGVSFLAFPAGVSPIRDHHSKM
jgi:hypothetical protein